LKEREKGQLERIKLGKKPIQKMKKSPIMNDQIIKKSRKKIKRRGKRHNM
jgi:hypothetical protein